MAKNNNYDVAKAFQDIESVLISSMTRNMQLHLDEQEALGYNWSQWQAEMLKGLDEYKKRNSKLLNGYTRKIDNQIDYAIKQAYLLGNSEQEIKILKALKRGYKCKIPKNVKKDLKGKNFKASLDDLIKLKESNGIEGAFFKVNDRKLNALIKATKNDFKKAEKAILRRTDDIYRQVIFSAQVYANTGAGTTWQAVDMATKQFLEKGIDCVQYKNGSQVNIASYAEMAIRTASKKAYLTGEGAKRKEWGIHTVIINSHNSACPLCIPFQNKVFIDNVYSGGTKQEAKETGYPSLSDAIAQGLFHPSCKDTSSTYFEGITNIPNKIVGEKEQLRRYNLEQKQRYMERQIRKYKRLEKGALDEENKEMYANKVAEWQQKNAWFIEENSDILRRDYAREKYRGVASGEIPKVKIEKSLQDQQEELSKKIKELTVKRDEAELKVLEDFSTENWDKVQEFNDILEQLEIQFNDISSKINEKENKKAINKFGDEIIFKIDQMKHKDRTIKTITDLSNEYNTSLREVVPGAKKCAGSVDLAGTMNLSTSRVSTVFHEFAHSLASTHADKAGLSNNKEFWKEIRKIRQKYEKACYENPKFSISAYSHDSVDEFMAEAFAQAKLINTEYLFNSHGKDTTYSMQVLEIIDKYFKKDDILQNKGYNYNKDGTIVVTHDWKGQHVSIPRELEPYAVLETDTKYRDGYYQIDRTLYDENKKMHIQIHSGHHDRPDKHPYGENGEHKHIYTWYEDTPKPDRTSEELNDEDRNQNKDIIKKGGK